MIVQEFKVKDAADDWAELEPVPPRPGAALLIAGVRVQHSMPAIKSVTVYFHREASAEFKVGNTLVLARVVPADRVTRKPVPTFDPKFLKGA